ncbi:MAG TPA: inositol monophosphatase family protein [Candidatus Limnocylindrales bacterium]|nr:inositol monophosphatase family protein [Candidatus Limnocylindrales bacterium]
METAYGPEWSAGLRRATTAELTDWLAFAHAACDVADELALDALGRRSELDVAAKADGSFVTDADQRIERAIRERIADRYPADGVVGEEYGTEAGNAGTRWYLDPIDGTHNFMRGVPLFGTLLAVERDGETQVGVVSAPALGRRWFASRGNGAWAVGGRDTSPRRLSVSTEAAIDASQILFRSVTDMRASRVSAGFDALLGAVWRERGFGDFWGYTLVADGAAEGMMERDLSPWDMAAPWIVVEEAGGRATDFDGRRSYESGESFASNGILHEPLLDRLWRREDSIQRPAVR